MASDAPAAAETRREKNNRRAVERYHEKKEQDPAAFELMLKDRWAKKKARIEADPDYAARIKDQRDRGRQKYNETHREHLQEYRYNYNRSLMGRWKGAHKGADKRGLDWTMTIDEFDLLTKLSCHYCGDTPARGEYVGVDREKNETGYSWANGLSCCWRCNAGKNDATKEEFVARSKRVAEHYFSASRHTGGYRSD